MGTTKDFNYSAFDTLTACETIVEQCIIDKEEILTVISICEIVYNIFKKDPVKQNMYSFTKTIEALGNTKGSEDVGGDETPPPAK